MLDFAKNIAVTATHGQLQHPEYAVNHRGEKDAAIFEFTTMHQAQYSCYARQRHGRKLLTCIVGDTLINVSVLFMLMKKIPTMNSCGYSMIGKISC